MLVFGCGRNPDSAQFTPGSPEAKGFDIYTRMACDACHSVNAKLNRGPTLKGQFGKEIRHTDGSVVVIDEQYIRESIIAPRKLIAEGFPPIMPSYKPVLNEEDIANIIAYIKALK
jgi:cytochrome c oxidase subunit 2